MNSVAAGLLEQLRATARRFRAIHRPLVRRSSLASTSDARHAVIEILEVEVYRLSVHGHQGVGASIYCRNEELLRFDCLGPTGHFHVNIRQSTFAAAQGVPRLAFQVGSVDGQVRETPALLRGLLASAIADNWNPAVRRAAVSGRAMEQVANWIAKELSDLSSPGIAVDTTRASRA